MEYLNTILVTVCVLLVPLACIFLSENSGNKSYKPSINTNELNELRKENERLRKQLSNHIYSSTKNAPAFQMKINIHGFSVNDMYEANPYYNSTKADSKKLRRTNDYREWRIKALNKMKMSHLRTLKEMNINPNKKMKIDINFGTKASYDVDNLVKSFLDTLVEYYNLPNDNNFYEINMKKEIVNNYKDGYIKFSISNL